MHTYKQKQTTLQGGSIEEPLLQTDTRGGFLGLPTSRPMTLVGKTWLGGA